MSAIRMLVIVVAILIVVGAGYLVFRGITGLGEDASSAGGEAAGEDDPSAADDEAPRWSDYASAGGPEEALGRELEAAPGTAPSPFDGAWARARLESLDLRVDGVAPAEGMALVSGRVLRLGDTIDAFTIDEIDTVSVWLVGPAGVRVQLVPGASTGDRDSDEVAPRRARSTRGETPTLDSVLGNAADAATFATAIPHVRDEEDSEGEP